MFILKKRWVKLLLALMIVWLVVTTYFYFQHRATVQVMKVSGWSLDNKENQGVLVNEIRVCDWEYKNTDYWEKLSSVIRLADRLPSSIQMKYFTIVSRLFHFYRDPYQKLENGAKNVMVIGMFLAREQDEEGLETTDRCHRPTIHLYSDDQLITSSTSGFGIKHSGDSNYYLFNAHNDRVYTSIKEDAFKITWQWDEGPLVSKSISDSSFESKTYNYFKRPPSEFSNLEPDRKAYQFITGYKDGLKEIVQGMVSSHVEDFPWQQIDWVKGEKDYQLSGANYYGEHKGFQNTFTVDLTSKDMETNEDIVKQKIFLIEESGEWKVIDVMNEQP